MLSFPLHFGIYPAKIFVMYSACMCVFEYMSVYKIYSVWNELFSEGQTRKKPLPVIDSCTQTLGIMGDQ